MRITRWSVHFEESLVTSSYAVSSVERCERFEWSASFPPLATLTDHSAACYGHLQGLIVSDLRFTPYVTTISQLCGLRRIERWL